MFMLLPISFFPALHVFPICSNTWGQHVAAWMGLLHLPFLQTSPQLGCSHLPSNLAARGHVGVTLLVPLHPALFSWDRGKAASGTTRTCQCLARSKHTFPLVQHFLCADQQGFQAHYCFSLLDGGLLQISWGKKPQVSRRERTCSRKRWGRVLCKSHVQSTKSHFFPNNVFSQVLLLITVTKLGPHLLQQPQREFFKGF